MLPEEIIKAVGDITKEELPAEYRTVLFGSWAQENARPTSDIDIGIVGDRPVPHELMVRIRAQVESIPTLRKVDVVDLQTVDPRFREVAIKQAKPL